MTILLSLFISCGNIISSSNSDSGHSNEEFWLLDDWYQLEFIGVWDTINISSVNGWSEGDDFIEQYGRKMFESSYQVEYTQYNLFFQVNFYLNTDSENFKYVSITKNIDYRKQNSDYGIYYRDIERAKEKYLRNVDVVDVDKIPVEYIGEWNEIEIECIFFCDEDTTALAEYEVTETDVLRNGKSLFGDSANISIINKTENSNTSTYVVSSDEKTIINIDMVADATEPTIKIYIDGIDDNLYEKAIRKETKIE